MRIVVQAIEFFLKMPYAKRSRIGCMKMRRTKSNIYTSRLYPGLSIVRNVVRRGIETLKQTITSSWKAPCVRKTVDLSQLMFKPFDRCGSSYYFSRTTSHTFFTRTNEGLIVSSERPEFLLQQVKLVL